jgi:hypothetical protein
LTKRLLILASLLTLLLLLGAAAIWYLPIHSQRQMAAIQSSVLNSLTPQERADYEAWRSQILTFPPEALIADPPLPETLTAAQKFDREVRAHMADLERLGKDYDEMGTSKYNYPRERIEIVQPVFDALESLVNQPDYHIHFAENFESPEEIKIHRLPFFYMGKITVMKCDDLTSGGRIRDALELAELMVRTGHAERFIGIPSHELAASCRDYGMWAWQEATKKCSGPALLLESLERLLPVLKNDYSLPLEFHCSVLDDIETIRKLSRHGFPITFQGNTGRTISVQAANGYAKYLRTYVLPKVQADPAAIERTKAQIADYDQWAELLSVDIVTPMISFTFDFPNDDWRVEMSTRDNQRKARLLLLSVLMASRIYELERDKPPVSWDDLVPALLESIPIDPFSPSGEQMLKAEYFYSLGPDQTDDQGSFLYDPTNGTISRGDVFLN